MIENKRYSQEVIVFHGRRAPEKGLLVGYGALYNYHKPIAPLPKFLCIISDKHKRYTTESWDVFTPRHEPENTLSGHLTFALKYEGLDLHLLKQLFSSVTQIEIEQIVKMEPTGQYSRRIWFLYEWLLNKKLNISDLKRGNYIDIVDEKLQYVGASEKSTRHRVRNNLPGVQDFCPLIRKTEILKGFIEQDLLAKSEEIVGKIRKDILLRAAAFLLLKDSKASYAIEGEQPSHNRLQRWGRVIGQAGNASLSKDELLRLQSVVIENQRFVEMGLRKDGGFVGEHDREKGYPLPEHISAKWQDLELLISGMLEAHNKLENAGFNPVLEAAMIAFGFVFIHPFVDGNGRIHRYLIHHILSERGFVRKGLVFPVSYSILEKIDDYSQVLGLFSKPRLEFIEWKPTNRNNVEVLNQTKDLYSYFDATECAEFLFSCVKHTIEEVLPEEILYLEKYDSFKMIMEEKYEMPDNMISLLVRFLEQGKGELSKRALKKEFKNLDHEEVKEIEDLFLGHFLP